MLQAADESGAEIFHQRMDLAEPPASAGRRRLKSGAGKASLLQPHSPESGKEQSRPVQNQCRPMKRWTFISPPESEAQIIDTSGGEPDDHQLQCSSCPLRITNN